MNDASSIDRFEELEAGRVLGDLSPEEWDEWKSLSETVGKGHDASLEFVAAAIEAEFASQAEEALPPHLADTLLKGIPRFEEDSDQVAADERIVRPDFTRRASRQVVLAWSVAAVLALLLVAVTLTNPGAPGAPTAAEAVESLRQSAGDLVKSAFGGLGAYEPMTGEVLWSDERQEGYMLLTNLPANNPSANQYQLWIVDPTRDEAPVDGGVFDIPAGQSTAIIPIDAKLAITKPQAFVITLEQPGGVVKSKQETVVALAKVS